MILPAVYIKQAELDKIEKQVTRAAKKLAPDVVRVRYDLHDDWSGDPAIFFRVVISDDAAREERLMTVTEHAKAELRAAVKPVELGLLSYFNYRSVSEQKDMREKIWD